MLTQSNVIGGTVYQEILSANNADSTLQIVKEQQPIFADRDWQTSAEMLFC
jgi:hypothetical protein